MRLVGVAYAQYIASPAWAKKRAERISLDDGKCFRCESMDGLNVHHITYERLGHERMSDLQTLCGDCHKREHGRDPSLPGELPDSFFRERQRREAELEWAQEEIALAAGVSLEEWWG